MRRRTDRSLKADRVKMSKESLAEPSRHSAAVSRVLVDSSSAGSPKKESGKTVNYCVNLCTARPGAGEFPQEFIHWPKLPSITLKRANQICPTEAKPTGKSPRSVLGCNRESESASAAAAREPISSAAAVVHFTTSDGEAKVRPVRW